MSVPLAPDIAAFVSRIAADYARLSGEGETDPAARRRTAEAVRAPWAAGGPEMASVETRTIGPRATRIRIHRPVEATTLPALIYLHGGGWVLFSIDTHDRLLREYAARSGCAVVGVDYPLAPEARFPAALEEIGEVLAWLRDHASEIGIDATRLAIGGDSAGANLALSSALRERDSGRPLGAMLLNYGAFDTALRDSHTRFDSPGYNLTAAEMRDFWSAYLGADAIDSADPLAKPLLADLHGLPPAFLCIAECDILADENLAMAERLRAAGVAADARVYPGASHSFLEAVSTSALADRALAEASRWLSGVLQAG